MARNRLYDEDVLVIGLGRFGAAAALELHRLGHKVLVMEKDPSIAEQFVGKVAKVVQGDAANPTVLESTRAGSFRIAVVGIGSSIEASLLAASNLVDAGVPTVWAKAVSPEHTRILERIGVHHVVRP
jgi:trk system potassium uptake protein